MNILPLIVINGILLVITILLLIADRLLVNYGECTVKIKKEDGEQEFTVQGGGYLLGSLIEQGVEISASCGGKATCGYCKCRVTSGGGELLPTEEVFMTKEEKRTNTRLACQVKIKNDLELTIPDYLETVRTIVENKLYDPNKRWRVTIE